MPARLRALLVALFGVAVLGALLPATAAHAESRTVQGGRLDWGVKTSFQSYVTGPVAKGSYSLTGGAATVGGSGFRFHSASGSYDAGTGAFTASFSGGVRFTGHRTDSGAHQLDLTLSRPTVRIAGSTGTLYVDVTGKAKGTGAITTSSQVPFASLSLGGIDMRGGGDTVVLTRLPATLTAQGARSFAGYYAAGTALDPVSLSADVRPARRQAKPSATPDARPSASAKSGSKKQSSGTALVDGAVDWGVRRTFREYVAGDIARGAWKLSAGAEDGGALFRFPDGEGTFENGDLSASFKGAIRFTGKDGLDLALSGVRVTITDGKGTLYATVRGSGADGEKIPLVTFTAKKPVVKDGLVRIVEAPTELTARGAKAFGGMYPAGTRMDPVSVAVTLKDEARLPALPDLGSTPTASGTPTKAAATPGTRPVASAAMDDGVPAALPVGLAAGALLLAAAAGWLVARRRRGATPSPDES